MAGGSISLSRGQFNLAAPISIIKDDIWLRGQGQGSILSTVALDIDTIIMNPVAQKQNIQISDLLITANAVKATGRGIFANLIANLTLKDLFILNQAYGISCLDCAIVHIAGQNIRETRTNVILIDGGNDYYLDDITADNTGIIPAAGLRLRHTTAVKPALGGFYATRCDFIHCVNGIYADAGAGKFVEWGFFAAALADSCTNGIVIDDTPGGTVRGLTFVDPWAGSNSSIGILVLGGKGIRFIGAKVIMNAGTGVLFNGGTDLELHSSDIWSNDTDNSGDQGILVGAGVNGFSIIGNRSGNVAWTAVAGHQRYGCLTTVGANNYHITNNNFQNNVTGGLSDGGGPTKVVINNL
jgi:hypothetical protein